MNQNGEKVPFFQCPACGNDMRVPPTHRPNCEFVAFLAAKKRSAPLTAASSQDKAEATWQEQFIAKQEALGKEFSQPLMDNLWDLYGGEKVSAWQPIETAPRDGQEILVWATSHVYIVWFGHGQWRLHDDFMLSAPVTHWMPLPPPPAALSAQGEEE